MFDDTHSFRRILFFEILNFFLFIKGNRTNQCNPNHQPSGPGRTAGYGGEGTKSDLNNHTNQENPNNTNYGGGNTKK